MKVEDIRTKAKSMGIKPNRMNKTELIRAIQRDEANVDCFATDRIEHCEEFDCLNQNRRRQKGIF